MTHSDGTDAGRKPRSIGQWIWLLLGPTAWLWELSFVAWAMLVSYLVLADGYLDWTGHAIGRDFINYWTAGHLTLSGQVKDIFIPKLFLAHERALFNPRLPFHFWSYPPPTLFLVAPLGLTDYFTGFALWSAAGVVALYFALKLWPEPGWVKWLILICPAVPTNIALGQNGAFTAALLLTGLGFWRERPRLAGVLLGLLIFKPQIALLLPVAVLAERRWSTMVAAAIAAGLVLALSIPAFGLDAWTAFFGPTLTAQGLMLSQGRGPFQWMMPSAFMAARVLGVRSDWAMAIQAPFSVLGVWLVWKAYRSDADNALKAAVLMTATFVASPQAFNYDLIPAAAAAIVLWRRDQSALARALCLLLWALPVFMIAAQAVHIVIAPLVLAGAAWKLVQLCDDKPSRLARASITRDVASNT